MDITNIIEAVFALVAALVTCIVIPYIKSKTTAEQQKEINSWVRVAVAAAEQIYVGSKRGAEKKQYVISFLKEHGITLDETKLDALIEATVYDLNTGFITIEPEIKNAVEDATGAEGTASATAATTENQGA